MNYATQSHSSATVAYRLPTIPGFFADPGTPYVPGSCAHWLAQFGLKEVPADQELETPLGIRIHDWERDWPHAQVAIEEGLELGFTPHLNIVDPSDVRVVWGAYEVVVDKFGDQVVQSTGNSTNVMSGFEVANWWDDEVQDDSGVRGAVANARALKYEPLMPISYHGYGNAGFSPKHIQGLRAMYPDRKFTIMELHWGFRGHERTKADKPELYTAEAGAYIRQMVEVAARNKMACCLFSFRDFFDAHGEPEPSMVALLGGIDAEPLKPPFWARQQLSFGMLRRRYLP